MGLTEKLLDRDLSLGEILLDLDLMDLWERLFDRDLQNRKKHIIIM